MTNDSKASKSININDFDPVFRKTEYQNVRIGAQGMISNKKNSKSKQEELKKIGQQKQANRQSEENFVDQDELEFRNEDPRKKAIDEDQIKKEELLIKLQHNHKFH